MRAAILILACAPAIVGCGGAGGTGSRPESGVQSAAAAKAELLATAKKMEGNTAGVVEKYASLVENGAWSWQMADDEFVPGKFTPETIAAYRKWRAARLAEGPAKK